MKGSTASRLPATLYHGTTTFYLDQMLRDGLEPCHMTGAVLMGCYTDDPAVAIHHAVCMAGMEEADPLLFKLPIDRFDLDGFTLDDKFVELHPSSGRGVFACALMGEKAWETVRWSWLAMLRIGGSVGYTRTVKVSADDLVQNVAWPRWDESEHVRGPFIPYGPSSFPAGSPDLLAA